MGSFRKTKQSALILDIIDNSSEHLNAYEVYEKCLKHINNISLGTVYRNLNNLVDNYQIRKIIDLNGVEHFDNLKIVHNHFICTNCNYIYDIIDDVEIPLSCKFGKILDYEIIYKGLCHNCCKEEK